MLSGWLDGMESERNRMKKSNGIRKVMEWIMFVMYNWKIKLISIEKKILFHEIFSLIK